MELFQLVSESIADTMASLWPPFAAELVICATILLLLILRLFRAGQLLHPSLVAFVGSLVALYYAYPLKYLGEGVPLERTELFSGMLVYDAFSVYIRSLLILFAVLFAILTRLSGIPDEDDAADFYCMVLGATLGMCLMASANHLLMVFMAVEMASVPSYVLAAMLKGRKEASEAALKYAVYGAGAAGVMLYGISLLTGLLNTAHLPTMAARLAKVLPDYGGGEQMVLVLAGIMVFVGLAFKLSAVPFHFWCPDVFEGASAEIGAFLSVASKAAALALLVRLVIGLGVVPQGETNELALASGTAVYAVDDGPVDDGPVDDGPVDDGPRLSDPSVANEVSANDPDGLGAVRNFMALVVAFIAVITCTFGNLAAYGQNNLKRLLAYSTIAHAGYMLLPIPAALVLFGNDDAAASRALGAVAIYLGIYLFMNLGAFAIVAFLRNELRSEQLPDFAGLVKQSPGVVICMAVIMFSLVGIPPLAGFVGKFAIFAALIEAFQITQRDFLMVLAILGGINTVISLFYYLRVVKVMAIDPQPEKPRVGSWSLLSLSGVFVVLVTLPLLLLFFNWNNLDAWATAAVQNIF